MVLVRCLVRNQKGIFRADIFRIGLVGKRLDICLARERLESGLVRGLVRNLKGIFRADIPGMLFKLSVDIGVHEQIPYL